MSASVRESLAEPPEEPAKQHGRLSAALTTKMTPEERAMVANAADAAGLSRSEFVRRELMKLMNGRTPFERHIAGELAAQGAVLVEVLRVLCGADAEKVRRIVSAADAGRLRLADLRWEKFRESR